MSWRRAYEYYKRRKEKVRRPLLENPSFRKFKRFIEWRLKKTLSD